MVKVFQSRMTPVFFEVSSKVSLLQIISGSVDKLSLLYDATRLDSVPVEAQNFRLAFLLSSLFCSFCISLRLVCLAVALDLFLF